MRDWLYDLTLGLLAIAGAVWLVSRTAHAEPLRFAPYVASAAGQFGDWGSSSQLPAGFGPCSETNLSVKATDGSYRIGKGLAVKGGIVAASWGLLWVARRSHARAAIRVAEGVNYVAGGIGARSAWRNVRCQQ